MTETHKGRCLCGAVEFEFEGKPNWVAYCHCESCRRNTSSPTTTFIGVGRDNYRFTKGKTAFYESSPGVRRHFCATCGTPMAFDADHYPEEIHFYLVSLLDPESFSPRAHVFIREKLSWFEIDDDLRRHQGGGADS